MARFPAKRLGGAFVPGTQDGRDFLNRVPHGGDVMISVTTARNMRQHRLWWALCGVLAEHFGMTKENMKDELCEKIGHVDPVFYSDGSMRLRAKSIACENMPAEEFDEFFRLTTAKAADMLDSAPQEVIDHVNSMLDPQHYSPPLAPAHSRERQKETAG